MLKKITLGLMGIVMVATMSACNTVQGVGKDIQRGGEKIEKAAR